MTTILMAVNNKTAMLVIWTLTPIQLLIAGGRFFILFRRRNRKPSLSDEFLILYLLVLIIGSALNTWLLYLGDLLSRDPSNTSVLVLQLKVTYAGQQLYYIARYALKATFLALYFQFFSGLTILKTIAVPLWISAFYLGISFLITELIHFLACQPLSKNWDLENSCSINSLEWPIVVVTTLSLTTDLLVMLIPCALIFKLQFTRRQSLAIAFVLSIGGLSVGGDAMRFVALIPLGHNNLNLEDRQRAVQTVVFWCHVGWACAEIAVCLPSYRLLWLHKRQAELRDLEHFGRTGETSDAMSNNEETLTLH